MHAKRPSASKTSAIALSQPGESKVRALAPKREAVIPMADRMMLARDRSSLRTVDWR